MAARTDARTVQKTECFRHRSNGGGDTKRHYENDQLFLQIEFLLETSST